MQKVTHFYSDNYLVVKCYILRLLFLPFVSVHDPRPQTAISKLLHHIQHHHFIKSTKKHRQIKTSLSFHSFEMLHHKYYVLMKSGCFYVDEI